MHPFKLSVLPYIGYSERDNFNFFMWHLQLKCKSFSKSYDINSVKIYKYSYKGTKQNFVIMILNDLKWYWKLLVRMIWNYIDIAMCYNLLLPVIDFCGVIIFALSTQPLKQTSARDK